ncbi:MAG TPA: twin-arginine translocase TatA/TatE family subunit [Rhodospirillales bacterium]|nr:twin-arginine translocase TatA/TatE family subunit [Rhodospirillales bacterium]
MSIGIWQVVLILLIVLILFGAGKLPKVMGDVAKGVKNFKKGLAEDDEESEKPKPVTAEKTEQATGPVVDATVQQRDEAAKS